MDKFNLIVAILSYCWFSDNTLWCYINSGSLIGIFDNVTYMKVQLFFENKPDSSIKMVASLNSSLFFSQDLASK